MNRKAPRLFFALMLLLVFSPAQLSADRRGFVNTVVIDPGHGGRAPGAVGRKSMEKDIALAISLKLGQYINEHLPDVRVIYTRETDISVGLSERARIANENQADLFISIHLNSTTSSSVYGTETFVMGLHRSQANLEVARKENLDILYEDDYEETYGGFDPHSPEASIIFTLYQNAYLDQSLTMASLVQDQFRERARRIDRGVKQAGFLVLYEITMPGILVEAGFISNPREEEYLMSTEGQAQIASAIFRAFREYKQNQDALAASRREMYSQDSTAISPETSAQTSPVSVSSDTPAITGNPDPGLENPSHADVEFRVQFAVSRSPLAAGASELRKLPDAEYYFHDGLYKYTSGRLSSLEEAARHQAHIHSLGFRDAFVVAFQGQERISAEKALELIRQTASRPEP